MEYLPPYKKSTAFNLTDYNYQDAKVTLKTLDTTLDDYTATDTSLQSQITTNTTKLTGLTYSASTSQPTGLWDLTYFTNKYGDITCLSLGNNAGRLITSGQKNIYVGPNSGQNSTTGGFNCGYGYDCLKVNVTGEQNCGFGTDTLSYSNGINYNTAMGTSALRGTTGNYSTGVGYQCGVFSLGANNSFFGTQAGYGSGTSSGTNNTATGFQSLYSVSTGGYNVSSGYRSLYNTTTSSNLVGIGTEALYTSATTQYNTAVGYQSCKFSTVNNNTGLGYQSCYNFTGGSGNTGIGSIALKGSGTATGTNNTAVGFFAGSDITSGGNNSFIGTNAGTASSPSGSITTQSNVICMGNSSIANAYIQVAWTVVSDARDKCNISNISEMFNSTDYIKSLQPKIYKMNDRTRYATTREIEEIQTDEDGNEIITTRNVEDVPLINSDISKADTSYSIGFLSQEVQEVENNLCPNSIACNDTNVDKMGIRYEAMIPILVDALKKQILLTELLQARVNSLEILVTALQN